MTGWLRRASLFRPAPKAEPAIVRVAGRDLPVQLRRLAQARRLTMRLAPDGNTVRLSLPLHFPATEALRFARERSDWLADQLQRLPPSTTITPGNTFPYRGAPLTITWEQTAPRRPVLDHGAIVLGGPLDSLEVRLKRWLQDEALRLLGEDLAAYCARAGRPVPHLALSNAHRRWGSCAANGTIRLNWRLIMAPDAVRRSVVAHEVAHLTHFDHSPAFHAELARLFEGSIDEANAWLKREGRALHRIF